MLACDGGIQAVAVLPEAEPQKRFPDLLKKLISVSTHHQHIENIGEVC